LGGEQAAGGGYNEALRESQRFIGRHRRRSEGLGNPGKWGTLPEAAFKSRGRFATITGMKKDPRPAEPEDQLRKRTRRIVRALARLYPEARCSLDFDSPLQLLVATILSAQCTDTLVNKITPALFARFPDAFALAGANPAEVEVLVQKSGFFRNKTKNILRCCKQIVERHNGEVPRSIDELVLLAGVGRKTANVLLGNAYGIAGIAVDTHVARLAKRLGLTRSGNPVIIERHLNALVAKKDWSLFGLRLIYHGRRVCRARRPRCEGCGLAKLCPKVGVGKPKEATSAGELPSASLSLSPAHPAPPSTPARAAGRTGSG
jgi:endonuclease-3